MKKSIVILISFLMMSVLSVVSNVNAADVDQKSENEYLFVRFDDTVDEQMREDIRIKYEDKIVLVVDYFENINTEVWEVCMNESDALQNQLKGERAIKYTEENKEYELDLTDKILNQNNRVNNEYFIYQWGLDNIGQLIGDYGVPGIDTNALEAWKLTQGSSDIKVGILDSGINIVHKDLSSSVYVNDGEIPNNGIDDDGNGYIDDVNGWDFLNEDNTVYDSALEDAHGTYAAGIIAGNCDMQENGIMGIAPYIEVVPLKFMNQDGGNTLDAARAIEYAEEMGIRIINCSWSGKEYSKILKETIKESAILFICSAGNLGKNIDINPVYPACYDIGNIITVGGIDNKGNILLSNWGQNVDLVAPGVNIFSTYPENSYIFASGTSGAAPFVTGTVALACSLNSELSNMELINLLDMSVEKNEEMYYNIRTKGRLDTGRLLEIVNSAL